MDGLINLNKPAGISSAKALYRVRSITGQRRSGHGGTLDPAASGVLLLCMGRATRLVELIMDQPKVYRSTARLDVTSESFDADRPLIPVDVPGIPAEADVRRGLGTFEGTIEQVPPAISAVKVGGVPAYRRALRGQNVKLRPRMAQVHWIQLHRLDWPEVEFSMACGRGTYVRALIRDLGVQLGTGGCLTGLVRERIGPFTLDDSWSIEAIRESTGRSDYLIPFEQAEALLRDVPPTIPPRPDR
ncbi:MAG: tRNA pseudouridine(55) synthase TruB [Phycisphaerae bacterium]|nr:tRNA pseudouridine(55) synthase TruB [Phycisphaerae bacterium]